MEKKDISSQFVHCKEIENVMRLPLNVTMLKIYGKLQVIFAFQNRMEAYCCWLLLYKKR